MVKNYFKIALRSFRKNKLYTAINVTGLSIGIAFCTLIYLYIDDERSFDQFQANKDLIYRINKIEYLGPESDLRKKLKDDAIRSPYLSAALAPTILEEIPEVNLATRYVFGAGIFQYQDKIFSEKVKYVDADFFKMFSFKVLKGNKEKLFSTKEEIVITESLARKYFDDNDPIGKIINTNIFNEEKIAKVTGVIEDPPANSSLDFTALIPTESRPFYEQNFKNWRSFSFPTFIQLHENANFESFCSNLSIFNEKYFAKSIESWRERQNLSEDTKAFVLGTTNLNDLHLEKRVNWHKVSNPLFSYILAGIGLLIFVIACINYISLSLTSFKARKIEVGIRKSVGANSRQIFNQFTMESQLLAFFSMLLGTALIFLLIPYFNEFTGKEIYLSLNTFIRPFVMLVTISVLVGFLAGVYPSLLLSRFKPVFVLKGKSSKLKSGFTRTLVVLQFSLSAFMILSSVIMYRQMNYVTTKDLGYNQEQIVVVPTNTGWSDEGEQLVNQIRNVLISDPNFISISGTSSSFSRGWSNYGYTINGQQRSAYVYRVDPEYANTLNLTFLQGRNFDFDRPNDVHNSVVVNEALVKDMGWEDPLSERFDWKQDSVGLAVIGVVKDYNFRSLEQEIEPMFLHINPEDGKITDMQVKVSPNNIPEALKKLQNTWKEIAGAKPFDYSFLDEDVALQYESYSKWMNIMSLSTFFAILIACLGLFGLAGINAVNQTKEIGIRKVLGANLSNILYLMNKQFVFLAIIAFTVATPVSWWIMSKWLADFQYAITIGWELYVVAMFSGLVVALTTVSYHSMKAATVNPAETLKYE